MDLYYSEPLNAKDSYVSQLEGKKVCNTLTKGGVGVFDEGFYGWFGKGGSYFVWNPELKISFAYIPLNNH